MLRLSTIPGPLKVALALTLGGALAGVIAWGTQTRASGPAGQVTATPAPDVPTPVAEVGRPPPWPPNHIAPDQAALDEVAMDQAALTETEQRCPPSWLLYESQLLGGSFCYPPTWKLVFGDHPILPPEQRPDGYEAALLLIKSDSSTGRELARLSIQITGNPGARPLSCPQPGSLAAGPLVGKVCFMERKNDNYNVVPPGSARIVMVALPHKLPDFLETRLGFEIADETPEKPTVQFSREDQREALGIIASVRFNP